MITKSSLAIAEAIAVSVNTDTAIHPKTLIAGLNEVSNSSAQYTDNFRAEVLGVTGGNGDHSIVLEATSSKVAEAVRGALDTIGLYGVPFAKAIADAVGLTYSAKSLQMLSYSMLEHKFINVDDPFFDSSIFPTEAKNKAFTYEAMDLMALRKLEFSYPSSKEILEYVDSNHPDVKEILSDTEYELSNAVSLLLDLGEIQHTFHHVDGVVDFTKVKSLEINRLMKAYVIITKMYVNEEPAPWVTKGSLADYREHVNMMFNGLIHYLINLKKIVSVYKARSITIAELTPVVMAKHSVAEYADANFLKGKVVVYYTDKALESGISLSEWVLAYFWGRLSGKEITPTELLAKPTIVTEFVTAYYLSIDNQLKSKAKQVFVAGANQAGVKFIASNELLLDRCKDMMPEGSMLAQWLKEKLEDDYERAYHSVCSSVNQNEIAQLDAQSPMLNGILSSNLVPAFLRVVGCVMAASIVEHTYVNKSTMMDVTEQREALHEALIKVLVSYSL